MNVLVLVVDRCVEAELVDDETALLRTAGDADDAAALDLRDLPDHHADGTGSALRRRPSRPATGLPMSSRPKYAVIPVMPSTLRYVVSGATSVDDPGHARAVADRVRPGRRSCRSRGRPPEGADVGMRPPPRRRAHASPRRCRRAGCTSGRRSSSRASQDRARCRSTRTRNSPSPGLGTGLGAVLPVGRHRQPMRARREAPLTVGGGGVDHGHIRACIRGRADGW